MNKVREEFWWFIHNMIAHPLGQIFHMIGWIIPPVQKLDGWIHDWTVPIHNDNGHG
jgi:hypothetical protein